MCYYFSDTSGSDSIKWSPSKIINSEKKKVTMVSFDIYSNYDSKVTNSNGEEYMCKSDNDTNELTETNAKSNRNISVSRSTGN